jgi:hypothetical protein
MADFRQIFGRFSGSELAFVQPHEYGNPKKTNDYTVTLLYLECARTGFRYYCAISIFQSMKFRLIGLGVVLVAAGALLRLFFALPMAQEYLRDLVAAQ